MSVKEKVENIENKLSKKESVKEYNAKYYAKNKVKLISNLCEKVECNICGKSISKNGLKLHKSKPICRRALEQKLRDEKTINDIKNNISIN
jgi:hypothetical protein